MNKQELRLEIASAQLQSQISQYEETKSELLERATLSEIGEMTLTIVHEIRNPLTTVILGLTSLQRLPLPESYSGRLSLALQEAERLCNLLRDILLYAKSKRLQYTTFEVNAVIRDVLKSLRSLPIAQNRTIHLIPTPATLNLWADQCKFQQIVINLVENACEAITAGEVVTVRIEATEDQCVCIRVHNGGQPISPEALPKLLQTFYTTKESGTGLGLAIVNRIVEAHQGGVQIDSSDTTGTMVSVWLPRRPESSIK